MQNPFHNYDIVKYLLPTELCDKIVQTITVINFRFYMPHGLTIDIHDNIWLTDVAMHQVFKFLPFGGENKPQITLGTAFEPGTDDKHYCKPASVAVLSSGEFFVADGYCNRRVIMYYPNGAQKVSWGVDESQLKGKGIFSFLISYKLFITFLT